MGPTKQTTTNETKPISAQVQPTLDKLLLGVQSAQDKGSDYYRNPLYVPSGSTTQSGWDALTGAATNPLFGQGVNAGYGYNNDLIAGGGLTTGQQGNLSTVNDIGAGYAGLSGAYDQNAPGYSTLRDNLLKDAVSTVGASFLPTGKYGSKSYIDSATKAAVDAVAPLDYQNFTAGVNNKYRSLDSQLGAAQSAFGMGQQGVGNTLGAESGLGTLFGLSTQPGQTLAQVGSAQDANQNAIRQAEADQWSRGYNAQTDLLAKLSSIGGLSPGAAGTISTGTQPGPSLLQTLLGIGLAGASLA